MSFFSKWFSSEKANKEKVESSCSDSAAAVSVETIQGFLNQIYSNNESDPLLAEAIIEIVCYQIGTENLIQRSFSIDYNRAERIMDQLEQVGIVGQSKGSKPREVLVKEEKDILERLKMAVELHSRYKGLNLEDRKIKVRNDFEIMLSGVFNEKHGVAVNLFKELDDESLANLVKDEDGFINYPNGVKLRNVDGAIFHDNVIHETVSKLGYNNGELYFSNHSDEGDFEEDYTKATCISYWELFTDKLVCLVRNDGKKVNYEFMRNCRDSIKNLYRSNALYYRLKNGIERHAISRPFLEKVLNATISIPDNIDKNKIIEALRLNGIEINMIKEVIEQNETLYELMTFGLGDNILFNMIFTHKNDIEVALSMPNIIIQRQSPTIVRIGFANHSVNIGKYSFTFGGENYYWLSNCLYDGYSMATLTDLIYNNEYYKSCVSEYKISEVEKKIINYQAECYTKIDKDILKSRISLNKFSDGYDSERINYIAMAAFYKQCDVLQEMFIESTYGEYEIISKTHTNGIVTTRIRAYHELFEFINDHSMPEDFISNAIVENEEECSGRTEGYVYVMTNSSIEGQVKIGKTTRDPYERAKELSSATGIPTPFVVVFYKQFKDCHYAEKLIHQYLEKKGYRVSNNREFFCMSINEAIEVVQSMYTIEQKET